MQTYAGQATPESNGRLSLQSIPHHVGIIMDGNGRWALSRGLPRLAGHQRGVDNIQRILECCVEHGIKVLTIYAFQRKTGIDLQRKSMVSCAYLV